MTVTIGKNKIKVPVIEYLASYEGPLFPEQVKKAKEMLSRRKLIK